MSSSGLIYAIIVLAWAAYLVPMWLRREDELNRARQTQRYSTAIKVLANKESFERRLPIAVGQSGFAQSDYVRAAFASNGTKGPAPAAPVAGKPGGRARQRTAPVTANKAAVNKSTAKKTAAAGNGTAQAKKAAAAKKTVASGPAARKVVTARVAPGPPAPRASAAKAPAQTAPAQAAPSQSTAAQNASTQRRRVNVINRRRRVVSILFTLTTLGTLVTADLGPGMLWTMAVPAATLSAYIVWLRKDEQARATTRVRRRAAAADQARQTAGTARGAERHQGEKYRADLLRAAQADTEELELRRAQSARRRSAAARARADRYAGSADPAALRRAANS